MHQSLQHNGHPSSISSPSISSHVVLISDSWRQMLPITNHRQLLGLLGPDEVVTGSHHGQLMHRSCSGKQKQQLVIALDNIHHPPFQFVPVLWLLFPFLSYINYLPYFLSTVSVLTFESSQARTNQGAATAIAIYTTHRRWRRRRRRRVPGRGRYMGAK